ncbi:arabinogalactan peptide 12 [Eutrema salsugineum]|uniref:arabinogalactan peptide 12 n=1 Tax=Eutrema salsugineum TaxID=72664 RepID=UPI000CED3D97|nr:arabinogalactan peptide 12 [Eutrema salsugineum]
MESMKMKLMVVLMVAIVAFSAVGKAAAQMSEAPAPSPTSDAAMFVPALFASVAALASGFLF